MTSNVTRMLMAALKHKVALIGLGNMGKNHYRVLKSNPSFEVVAVVDPNKDSLSGLENPPEYFPTHKELKNLKLDAAIIASATETHFEIAKELLEMGIPLLVEKPLANSPSKANALASYAKEKNILVGVGHVERANPAVRKLKEVIEKGWLGKPIHYNFTRVGGYPNNVNKGNNVLLDLAVHDLDILNYLEGKFEVKASVCHRTIQSDIPDTAEILLSKEKGSSANIHVNWITPTKIRTLRVTGTKGVCFVDYMLQTCVLWGGNLLDLTLSKDFDYKDLQTHYRNSDKIEFGVAQEEPLKVQLREFEKALRGEKNSLCLAHEGAVVVDLAEKALGNQNL